MLHKHCEIGDCGGQALHLDSAALQACVQIPAGPLSSCVNVGGDLSSACCCVLVCKIGMIPQENEINLIKC